MSKRRYKSVEFKQVDWNLLQDRIEGERVVLAVDVAKEDFVGTLMDAEQAALVTFKWRHPEHTGGDCRTHGLARARQASGGGDGAQRHLWRCVGLAAAP